MADRPIKLSRAEFTRRVMKAYVTTHFGDSTRTNPTNKTDSPMTQPTDMSAYREAVLRAVRGSLVSPTAEMLADAIGAIPLPADAGAASMREAAAKLVIRKAGALGSIDLADAIIALTIPAPPPDERDALRKTKAAFAGYADNASRMIGELTRLLRQSESTLTKAAIAIETWSPAPCEPLDEISETLAALRREAPLKEQQP